MTDDRGADRDAEARDTALRGRLVLVALTASVVSAAHFVDHVIRGQLVVDRRLNPDWNHSGWPFQPEFNLFTISLLLVFGFLLGGILITLRGRLWAGYWLATSLILGALASFVHFREGEKAETPGVIVQTYNDPALSIPALIVLFGLCGVLVAMAIQAVRVRQASGRWW